MSSGLAAFLRHKSAEIAKESRKKSGDRLFHPVCHVVAACKTLANYPPCLVRGKEYRRKTLSVICGLAIIANGSVAGHRRRRLDFVFPLT
ncbi:MAG: hypothetical protein JRN52_06005 [Nitrososphaerota archaeon]|nr:hypothetical protein [Nitrososphaerota archaeon]